MILTWTLNPNPQPEDGTVRVWEAGLLDGQFRK